MVEKNSRKISPSFEENIRYMNEILPVAESFDIIRRDIIIGGKASVFYYIDGFIKDEVMLKIMDSFLSVTEEDMPEDAEGFIQKHVPYVEVDITEDFDEIIRNVLSVRHVFLSTDIKSVSFWTAVLIRREVWMNRTKTNPCVAPETDLWRRSYLIRL